ncbi:hypothetical protein [Actinoplanes subtropicus]|uniref:hypothetical protein n=1 Tax=Actinoplanes subtropicus TaxID=543632 RepID=UPI000AA0CFCD|nr:hypothetical protein [Actinoplanes subtropicus]
MLYACAAAVVVAVLAPLARAGYVLRYDMVFVPRQPLRWDLLAPAGTLPRAVPQDALVGLSAVVAPGWLVQRVVLAAVLAAAAIGAGRLVPARRAPARVVAAIGYAWTPFLAERLLIGQWGLLVCYAAMPWLIRAARDVRLGRPGAGARVVLAAACAAVTPTGGLIALVTTVVLVRPAGSSPHGPAGPRPWRPVPVLPVAVAALNAPWVVVAAGSGALATSDPGAVGAFAARGENWGGMPAALAGTGGIWNAAAVPGSRSGPLVPLVTAGLLVLAGFGFGALRRRWAEGTATRLAWLAGGSLLVSALGAVPGTSGALRAVVDQVPGAGLLRDGQKFLIPYAICLVLCFALGAERIADRVPGTGGRVVLAGLALLPVVALPDLAWGAGGKLRPVEYPAEWETVAAAVRADPGPVVSLPMSAYRAYPWNSGAIVYDPAGRYLAAPVVADDRLRVGDTVLSGESAAAAEIRARLADGRPVADEHVRWVLVQRDTGGSVPPAGLGALTEVHRGPALVLYRNPGYAAAAPDGDRLSALVGYLLAGMVVVVAGWRRFARTKSIRRRQEWAGSRP